jgi:hypothetical protein
LFPDRAVRASFFPKAKNQFLFGGVGLWASAKFSTSLPAVLNALQSPFSTHRTLAFSDACEETDDDWGELPQPFGGNQSVKGPDVYALLLEVVEAIDN